MAVPAASRRDHSQVEHSSALKAVHAFAGALLIVESGEDDVISPKTVEAYRAAAHYAQYFKMDGAAHDLHRPEWRAEFLSVVLDFLAPL